MTARIDSTIPVLASLDLHESARFYTERLGFTQMLLVQDYLIVQRDGAEIHFWLCGDRRIAENTCCYLRVPNTQALFEEFTARGLELAPPAVRPWGMKELYVIDPHGNLLKLGEHAPA
jgi:catechol 2,3-dioxygenase-like lactoylglutathione lyase family enzyme